MAALGTLTLNQKLVLANSLQAAAALVYAQVQKSPIDSPALATAQLAATKALLDTAQG